MVPEAEGEYFGASKLRLTHIDGRRACGLRGRSSRADAVGTQSGWPDVDGLLLLGVFTSPVRLQPTTTTATAAKTTALRRRRTSAARMVATIRPPMVRAGQPSGDVRDRGHRRRMGRRGRVEHVGDPRKARDQDGGRAGKCPGVDPALFGPDRGGRKHDRAQVDQVSLSKQVVGVVDVLSRGEGKTPRPRRTRGIRSSRRRRRG